MTALTAMVALYIGTGSCSGVLDFSADRVDMNSPTSQTFTQLIIWKLLTMDDTKYVAVHQRERVGYRVFHWFFATEDRKEVDKSRISVQINRCGDQTLILFFGPHSKIIAIKTPLFIRTETPTDPEVDDRIIFPLKERPGLAK